jgi:hypothetical protein
MLRFVSLAALAAFGAATFSAPAAADHRWRHRHVFFPLVEVFPGGWEESDEYAIYDDDEFTDEDYERIMRRRAKRQARQWWLYEDEDLEPVPAKPKKKTVTKKAAKPAAKPKTVAVKKVVKPVEKPASLVSTAKADTVAITSTKQTASLEPAPKPAAAKSIGCTAGAAVVTGYGFGDVKPKTCTGATYAYTASRGGKSYEIKLTAASGEVVDVKKL